MRRSCRNWMRPVAAALVPPAARAGLAFPHFPAFSTPPANPAKLTFPAAPCRYHLRRRTRRPGSRPGRRARPESPTLPRSDPGRRFPVYKPLSALLLTGLFAVTAAAEPAPPAAPTTVPAPSPEDGPLPLLGDGDPAAGPRLLVGVEYVLWWLREGRMPATLTTSSQASRGLLGEPDTRVLYGDERLPTRHGDRFNGVRASLAYW